MANINTQQNALWVGKKEGVKVTIVYSKQRFPPPPYDVDVADMQYFRALYQGDHEAIFPRAMSLVDSETVQRHTRGPGRIKRLRPIDKQRNAMHHYVVVNLTPVIAELPADLINRALGNISADTENGAELAFIQEVAKKAETAAKIWGAVVQQQIDGRVAYRIRRNESGRVWFEWVLGDRYFPHSDDEGADFAWIEEQGEAPRKDRFLRVERHRLDGDKATIDQLVFKMEGNTVGDQIEIAAYANAYGQSIPEPVEINGVDELLCGLVVNNDTLLAPRGVSALNGIDTIQEEINWTITRDSIVFEKHGKPKLAIPRKLWETVADKNNQHYGQRFVRSADLEVVSYDENNGAVPQYIVWDAKLEQSFEHVQRLIEYMCAVSKTSPQAAGVKEAKGETGVALLYLWIQSVIKAEAIKDKFDQAMKDAIRKCILLENTLGGKNLKPDAPVIEWGDMLPKAESERDSEEIEKYTAGAQSLETTVRKLHPDWTEKAIAEEIKKIEDEKAVEAINPKYQQPPKARVVDG